MALTTNIRQATMNDADFLVKVSAIAGDPSWTTDTVKSLLDDNMTRIFLVEITWPERGISTPRIVAGIHGWKDGTDCWIHRMAIDPDVVADTGNNQVGRRTIADRLFRRALEFAMSVGCTTGRGQHVLKGSKMDVYLSNLGAVTRTDNANPNFADYSGPLADIVAFLLGRSG